MDQQTPIPAAAPAGTNFPSTKLEPRSAACPSAALMTDVGQEPTLAMRCHVARVLADLEAGCPVSDDDLLLHRDACRWFMEDAHVRWLNGQETRETVDLWHQRFMEACRRLSPEWKAAREAEIMRAAVGGPGGSGCYFIDAGERDRKALERRAAGA